MAFRGSFQLFGLERSFFTRKMEATFRAMGVDYEFRLKTQARTEWLEARAGTHLIPVVLTPEDWMLWDSTPMAFDLERRFPGRNIVPTSPVQRMACLLIEDWVDEWLPRVAVHSRWMYDDNAAAIARSLGTNVAGFWVGEEIPQDKEPEVAFIADFIRNGFGNRACNGLAATSAEEGPIRAGFDHQLDLLAAIFETQPFLFGDRISLADVALVGAFVSHFLGDPEPRTWVEARQPSLVAWVERAFHTTVGEEDWLPDDALNPLLFPLFDEIAREFHPHLAATYSAMSAGSKRFEMNLDGRDVEFMVVPYREASRQFVRDEFLQLDATSEAKVKEVLGSRGLLDVYQLEPLATFHHQSPAGTRHPVL